MTQLIERDGLRVDQRPPAITPPTPRRPWRAWLIGLGVLVVVLAVGFAVTNLIIGDEAVDAYDRGAEHGDFTPMIVYQSPEITTPGYLGQDANLDPDIAFEHGDFTPMIVYESPAISEPRFLGQDANLDPDVVAQAAPGTIDSADLKFFQFEGAADPGAIDPADLKFFQSEPDPADLKYLRQGG